MWKSKELDYDNSTITPQHADDHVLISHTDQEYMNCGKSSSCTKVEQHGKQTGRITFTFLMVLVIRYIKGGVDDDEADPRRVQEHCGQGPDTAESCRCLLHARTPHHRLRWVRQLPKYGTARFQRGSSEFPVLNGRYDDANHVIPLHFPFPDREKRLGQARRRGEFALVLT